MSQISTLVVLSSAHEVLFDRYFRPTLPAGLQLELVRLADNKSDGSFLSPEWQNAMCAKVRHALDFCRSAKDGQMFLVSDVDVQFFPRFDAEGFRQHFESFGCDLVFQKERFRPGDSEVNCGFYAGRNTEAVRDLLQAALQNLQADQIKNEQMAVNALLRSTNLLHASFDRRFYARTHGFPPPKDIWMHHASWTTNIPEKIRQLDRVRRIVNGSVLRMHVEAYAEHIERAKARSPGLKTKVHATLDYLRKLPLKPCSLP